MLAAQIDQGLGSRHDLCHTCLIVRTQKSGAVGDDQVFAMMVLQGGIVALPQEDPLLLIQAYIAAGVFYDLCLDVGTGSIGRSVHVSDKADGWQTGISGNGAVDIAVFIHPGIRNAHLLHFLHQCCPQFSLLGSGRAGFGSPIGLGIKGYIAQEALGYCLHSDSPNTVL